MNFKRPPTVHCNLSATAPNGSSRHRRTFTVHDVYTNRRRCSAHIISWVPLYGEDHVSLGHNFALAECYNRGCNTKSLRMRKEFSHAQRKGAYKLVFAINVCSEKRYKFERRASRAVAAAVCRSVGWVLAIHQVRGCFSHTSHMYRKKMWLISSLKNCLKKAPFIPQTTCIRGPKSFTDTQGRITTNWLGGLCIFCIYTTGHS